jgi:hypothetical protein
MDMSRSIAPYRLVAFAVFLSTYPLSYLLPARAGWENGAIENLQVIAYAIGFVQAGILAGRAERSWRALWLATMPIWFILAARELSWGAVFYSPSGFDEHGPKYQASKLLWYNDAVTPMAALLLFLAVAAAAAGKIWQKLPVIAAAGEVPVLEGLMVVVSVVLMTAAEHHMGMSLDSVLGEGQVFEELIELAGSLFLLVAQQRIRLVAAPAELTLVADIR